MTTTTTPPSPLDQTRRERDRFVAFSFAAADMLLELDAEQARVIFVSGAAKAVTGFTNAELLQNSFFSFITPSDRPFLGKMFHRISKGGRIPPVIIHLVHKNTQIVPVILGGCLLENNANYYVTLTLAEKILRQGNSSQARDDATGMLDAEAFSGRATEALTLAQQTGVACQVTLLDLGDLQKATRQATQEDVEMFLSNVGAYLRSTSLDGDTAGLLESSKFAVVHDSKTSERDIKTYVSQLAKSTIDPTQKMAIGAVALDVGSNILSGEDTAKALRYAVNKFVENGAENYTISSLSESIGALMDETLGRVSNLKNTVTSDSFHIVFQPIVDLQTLAVHHYEVLSRFENGKSPFEVIRFAEEIGMIHEFDLAVCQRALDTLQGIQGKRPHFAINLSAKSLESSIFVASLQKLLAKYPDVRGDIMFEVTESAQITNFSLINGVLQTLRREGHLVCLDDVGAGATSFDYLRSLFVDIVKIDGSYIRGMKQATRNIAFVEAIAHLCQSLNVKTIAEMVETQDEAELLKTLKVNYAQGYYYGKPSPLLPTEEETELSDDTPQKQDALKFY
jgi:EAL domain-containing protein (putative c-di-GMP-specific phosphodiesterase class I)/GGDEF domain-containing protein